MISVKGFGVSNRVAAAAEVCVMSILLVPLVIGTGPSSVRIYLKRKKC